MRFNHSVAGTESTPMRRMSDPAEVANLAVLLASDESPFITGAGIVIDGGYSTV